LEILSFSKAISFAIYNGSWQLIIDSYTRTAISSPIYNGGWQMTRDSQIRGQYLKLIGAEFLFFVLVYVSRDFEVGSKSESTVSPYWANLLQFIYQWK